MTDKDKIKFAIRYLKQGLKSKRTPPLYEELMNELGFVKKVHNFSGVAVDFFKENYPEYVTEKGKCLSPYWDLFSAGVICATFECKVKIEQLEKENAELQQKWLDESYEKAKCIKSLDDKNKEINYLSEQIQELKIELDTPESVVLDKLDEAKEHIRTLISCLINWIQEGDKDYCYVSEAEQFLKEE